LQPGPDSLIVHAVSEQPENFNVPMWKFFVALAIVLIGVILGTMLWMWRENKPRRRPAILGAPQTVRTNAPGR
jgi:hypothetical protein